ncbi:MAG: protein kinase [Propionibacteriaceae bacterium]|jgi:serine/threonine protein kinase|nr:protein kinase [Propionibacteriaceae bacterium]
MARRIAPHPDLPGWVWVRDLGSGGFADVYLYKQADIDLEVAVKVLDAAMAGSQAEQRLRKEAQAMVKNGLSRHTNIVSVLQTGMSADHRAWMMMEYYSGKALNHKLSTNRRSLSEILMIAVQLAGAVESAHRVGVLHRDIKPANILTDRQGRPMLGDFGIAATAEDVARGQALGLSPYWSPPESFDPQPLSSPQSDIWSLGATIYALISGHAPFYIPGGDNSDPAIEDRICHAPYRPTGRADVPGELEQVLATALAKAPFSRYLSMQSFGRALQEIQQLCGLPVTPMEITDLGDGDGHEEASGTQLAPPQLIDPSGAPATSRPSRGHYRASANQPWASDGSSSISGGQSSWGSPVAASTQAPPTPGWRASARQPDPAPARQPDPAWSSPRTPSPQAAPQPAENGSPVAAWRTSDTPASSEIDPTQFRRPPQPASADQLNMPQSGSDDASGAAWRAAVDPPINATGPVEPLPPVPPSARRWLLPLVIALVVALLAGVLVWLLVFNRSDTPSPIGGDSSLVSAEPTASSQPQDIIGADRPPAPADLACTLNDPPTAAHCSWADPVGFTSGDSYVYQVTNGPDPSALIPVNGNSLDLPLPEGQATVCMALFTRRSGQLSTDLPEIRVCAA